MTEIKKARKRRRNDPPVKACPECFAVSMAAVRECYACGHTFHRTTKKDRQEEREALEAWKEAERLRAEESRLTAALADIITEALAEGVEDTSNIQRYAPCNTWSRGEARIYG